MSDQLQILSILPQKENATANGKRPTKSASSRSAPATPATDKDDEYMLVPTGAKDTGLTGKYWADMAELPAARRHGCQMAIARFL